MANIYPFFPINPIPHKIKRLGIKILLISCIFYVQDQIACAQNTNTTLLIIVYPCVSVN
jgi:hypothetical protein